MKKVYLHKAKNQIARPNMVRDINRQIVLNYVRDRAPISRAEIARETALQRSTVSAIVEDLQAAGLVEEIGSGSSTGGRKPTMLQIKSGSPVAVGVDITPSVTTVAVADLAGKILDQTVFETSPKMDLMTIAVVEKVTAFAETYGNNKLEVGISVPGITDNSDHTVLDVPYFQWRNWDIGRQIAERTGLPVNIENDANAVALAELWFGHESVRKIRNFITVLVAEGIGTGIIFDGQIYHGERGAAGEFGHMIVAENAPVKCSCGGRSCWEAHASNTATLARYRARFSNNGKQACRDFDELVGRALKGETLALEALRESAKFLGIGISNLIIGLSPQAVIVNGAITQVWDVIREDLNSISERSVRSGLPKTRIIASSLGDHPTLMGALTLVLARKFALSG